VFRELNCWITAIPCEWYDYQGVRLRVRDDVNNWTRSDDLAPGEDIAVEIVSPEETAKFDYDSEVVFTAQLTVSSIYQGLENNIEWEILTPNYESVIPAWEDWKGTTFTVEHIRDCWLTAKASLTVCGVEYSDELTVVDPPDIDVHVEPGPYWIDGPSIPLFPDQEGDWHDTSLQTVEVDCVWPGWGGCDDVQAGMSPEPLQDQMLVGQVKIKLDVDEERCQGFYNHITLEILGPPYEESETLVTLYEPNFNEYRDDPYVWDLIAHDEDCGLHHICAVGWTRDPSSPGGYKEIVQECLPVSLSMVEQVDLITVASIYENDHWEGGWQCCPHNPGHHAGPPDIGYIDCSGFVTQILRRLARTNEAGQYPHEHRCAECWQSAWCVEPVSWNDVREGDIISWDPKPGHTMGHAVIFVKWANGSEEPSGDNDHYICWDSAYNVLVQQRLYQVSQRMHPLRWKTSCAYPVFNPCL